MLMCLWLEPLFLVVTDRDTYTYGGGGPGTCFVPAALLSCLPSRLAQYGTARIYFKNSSY